MKTIALIPVWKRPEILELVVRDLQKHKAYVLIPVFIVSPEDRYYQQIKKILKYEITYQYYNQYLGEKMNFGIQMILQNFKFDYMMNFGSDNRMSTDIWELYKPFIGNVDIFGVNSVLVVDTYTDKEYILKNTDYTKAVGVGRMIRRQILETMVNKGQRIYDPEINSGLDTNSSNNIMHHLKIGELIIKQEKEPLIVDLKSNTNINHIMFLKKYLIEV